VLTDRGTEYCGDPEHHEYQLHLALEDIDHSRTKTKSPQTTDMIDKCFLTGFHFGKRPKGTGRRMTRITYTLPATGYVAPLPSELRKLQAIVSAAHPWLRADDAEEREFTNAFWAQGHFFRTPEPCASRSFEGFLDEANGMLIRQGEETIGGRTFLAAILAAGDVAWRRADPTRPDPLRQSRASRREESL